MTVAIVGGALANKPGNGGEAWVRLSWIRGLAALGIETYFLEDIDAATLVGADGGPSALEPSLNRAHFRRECRRWGLDGRAGLRSSCGGSVGMSADERRRVISGADVLINISGHLEIEPALARIPVRVFVDLDPGFTQFWAAQGQGGSRLEGHTHYFTVGERIGESTCPIPTLGLRWRPVRQPVVLSDWPVQESGGCRRFTTVGSWRGAFGPVTDGATTYGVKAHEFRKVRPLPRRVGAVFEAALAIHPSDEADRRALTDHGWRITDPDETAGSAEAFRRYVQGSDAEFSVAQGIYVHTRSGWFSDRTVRYLASGRPALVQGTELAPDLPRDAGIVTFDDLESATRRAGEIVDDYPAHAREARRIAETRFSAPIVLGRLLDEVGLAP